MHELGLFLGFRRDGRVKLASLDTRQRLGHLILTGVIRLESALQPLQRALN